MSPVIEITDLSKSFGTVRALDHLDLTVERGEVHSFLGPNGAGKTTALRVLLGRCAPTPAPPASWTPTRGATSRRCTGGSRTCPATSRCGPTYRR